MKLDWSKTIWPNFTLKGWDWGHFAFYMMVFLLARHLYFVHHAQWKQLAFVGVWAFVSPVLYSFLRRWLFPVVVSEPAKQEHLRLG